MRLIFYRTKPFFLVLFALLLSVQMGYAQKQSPADSGQYTLGAGDVLNVMVYGEPEISQTVFVRIDGRISLPLAGEVDAAGVTPAALADKITEKLDRFLEAPNVTVVVSESRSKAYYILGQIESPGEYPITRKVTVIQAIARAGGFLEWAKKDSIMIVSGPEGSEQITYFNYDNFLGGDDRNKNIVLRPGDTIVVP
jgi:polysaccharide export outer membrane protein